MRKLIQYIPAVATFLIGGGLQVSGIEIPWLGYSLMGLGVLLLLIPLKLTKSNKGAKPKLKVEKSEFRPLKWVLKIINESEDTAENCIGTLEMVEEAKPLKDVSWDMFGSRRLMWEDKNSIPGRGSAILRVINMINKSTQSNIWFEYTPAYEKPDFPYQLAFPNHNLILVISLRSQGCRPLYTICYFYHKYEEDVSGMHVLEVIAANLEQCPMIDECRKILVSHKGGPQN
jgi:hypothetical protein